MGDHSLEIDFVIYGIEIDLSYIGSIFSVFKYKSAYRGENLPSCILLQYRVSVAPDDVFTGQEYINHVLLEEGTQLLHILTLLLVRPSQLLLYQAKLDGEIVKLKLSPQYIPMWGYNFKARWSHDLISIGYSSRVSDDGWSLLETMISEFRQRPSSLRSDMATPLRWFAKGADEMTFTDRLIAFWISFNALYADSEKFEQDAINSYMQNNLDVTIARRYVDEHKQLLSTLSRFPIELGRKRKRSIAQELLQALNTSNKDYSGIVQIAVLTIYGVRNNLFHGEYHPDSGDQTQITVAENLLSRLVREFIAKQILDYPLPLTRFVTQTKEYL